MIPEIERDAMHPDRALAPYSGALLGALVKAFDLDDEAVVGAESVVGGRYSVPYVLRKETTQDYFRGRRPIKQNSEEEIVEAVCWGLVRAGIVPPVQLPPNAATGLPGGGIYELVYLGIRHLLWAWDGVRGSVSSLSASVTNPKTAALPFMRLFAIDLALRLQALLLLTAVDFSASDSVAWATPDGRGWLLQRWFERAGTNAPTKTGLAARLTGFVEHRDGASHQAVGYWLDGSRTPSAQHMIELAREFSSLDTGESEEALLAQMRRFYGLWRLGEMLSKVVGWDVVQDAAARISRYIDSGQALVRLSGDVRSSSVQQLLVCDVAMGLWKQGGEHGAASLTGYMEKGLIWRGPWTKSETDPVWKTDLLVCGSTAKLVSGHSGDALAYGVERQLLPFTTRIQHCYQRGAAWEAVTRAVPELADAKLPPPFDHESTYRLMNSYHRLWPPELRAPWEALSRSHPTLLANQYEQMAADEQVWGFYEDAIEYWKLAIQNAPDDAYKLFRLGALYGEVGEVEAAKGCLRRASDLDPLWLQPTLEIGRILMHVGQYQDALAHLQKVPPEAMNTHVFGQYLLGHAFAAQGQLKEAAAAFERLTELQSDNAGAFAEASLSLFQALKANPNTADRKVTISRGKEWAKKAALMGDDRAKAAWTESAGGTKSPKKRRKPKK